MEERPSNLTEFQTLELNTDGLLQLKEVRIGLAFYL